MYTSFFRGLFVVDTFCLQKQVVLMKWIHPQLEAPQPRPSDSRCSEGSTLFCPLGRFSLWARILKIDYSHVHMKLGEKGILINITPITGLR